MSQRIVVDPVTRIEGHLRIDVEVDGGEVKKASLDQSRHARSVGASQLLLRVADFF